MIAARKVWSTHEEADAVAKNLMLEKWFVRAFAFTAEENAARLFA